MRLYGMTCLRIILDLRLTQHMSMIFATLIGPNGTLEKDIVSIIGIKQTWESMGYGREPWALGGMANRYHRAKFLESS